MNYPDSSDMQNYNNCLDLMQLENVEMQLIDFQCNLIRNKTFVSVRKRIKELKRH